MVEAIVQLIVELIPILAKVFSVDVDDIKAKLAAHPEIQSRAADKVLSDILEQIKRKAKR